jgi:hypothetical protein
VELAEVFSYFVGPAARGAYKISDFWATLKREGVYVEPVEVKVTWKFAWGLWWRQILFSLAISAIIYIPVFLVLVAIGIRTGF